MAKEPKLFLEVIGAFMKLANRKLETKRTMPFELSEAEVADVERLARMHLPRTKLGRQAWDSVTRSHRGKIV